MLDNALVLLYIIDELYSHSKGRMNMGQIKYLSREEQGRFLRAIRQSKNTMITKGSIILYFVS